MAAFLLCKGHFNPLWVSSVVYIGPRNECFHISTRAVCGMCKANENSRALAKAFKDLGPVPRHCISPSFSLAYAFIHGRGRELEDVYTVKM